MIEKFRPIKIAEFPKKITAHSKGGRSPIKDADRYRTERPSDLPFDQNRLVYKHTAFSGENRRPGSLLALFLIMAFFMPSLASAHRGAVDEIDPCRIRVGFEKIHFTAYTPTISPGQEYCNVIPNLGPTNLVFDYEGKKLRDVSVEFEVTKEPEGTRVFYQEPKKIKTGTVNGVVDFSQFGAGDYLAHVAIVHGDKKLDTHLPLSVGVGGDSDSGFIDLLIWVASGVAFILLMVWFAKRKEDRAASQ